MFTLIDERGIRQKNTDKKLPMSRVDVGSFLFGKIICLGNLFHPIFKPNVANIFKMGIIISDHD